tara:strand:- start:1083 stop:1697 length:615 start_codon:yes stop_codon:yes gene_type:complete
MFNPRNSENDFFHKLDFNFDSSSLKPGDVLISEPFLPDPNFSRSVVLITEFDKKEGAFGFIINKPSEFELCDVSDSFQHSGYTFHSGGPVNTETLFFLINNEFLIRDTSKVKENLCWSGDFEAVTSLIEMGKIGPKDVKFFGGYSGWGVGQLENEIKEKSWIIGKLSAEDIISGNHEILWKKSLEHLGNKFSIMSNFPENPNMN